MALLVSAAVLGTAGVSVAAAAAESTARDRTAYEAAVERELVSLHNQHRANAGVTALTGWTDIRDVARGWAQELGDDRPCAGSARLCHNAPPASSPAYHEEYGCWRSVGENLVFRGLSGGGHRPSDEPAELAARFMDDWMTSSSHRTHVLDAATDEFGIGVHLRSFDDPTRGPSWEVFAVANFRQRDHSCTVAGQGYAGPGAPNGDPELGSITRIAGADRIATAIALADQSARADVVVLASATNYPDALAAAPLAGVHSAPLLLTGATRLDPRVGSAIERLGATTVVLLGGTGALSSRVERDVRALDGVRTVERMAGSTRWETAVVTAEAVGGAGERTVLLVEGDNDDPARGWPDALAASAYAARTGTPILLTLSDRLPTITADALRSMRPDTIVVIGGTGAVEPRTASQAAQAAGGARVERWSGDSRFATSMEVDRHQGTNATKVFVATGLNWADAIAAGPAAAIADATMLLVHGQSVNGSIDTADWVSTRHPNARVTVVGGTGVVTGRVADLFR